MVSTHDTDIQSSYVNIWRIPNPNRKPWQFWKRKTIPNPDLEVATFDLGYFVINEGAPEDE